MLLKNVLIYDKDVGYIQNLIQEISKKDDYGTQPCSNVFQFGSLTKNGGNYFYAIIISADVLFETGDFIKFLEDIKTKNPFTRIIVAFENEDARLQTLNEYVDAVIYKHSDPSDFFAILEKEDEYRMNSPDLKIQNIDNFGIIGKDDTAMNEFTQIGETQNQGFVPQGLQQQTQRAMQGQNAGMPSGIPPQMQQPMQGQGVPPQYQQMQPMGIPPQMQQPQPMGYPPQMQQGIPQQQYPQQEQTVQQPQFYNGFFEHQCLTIHSPKGGVGKTTVSKELSAYYASIGKKTCLIDMDIDYGDDAVMLDLRPTKNITHWAKAIQRNMNNNPNVDPANMEFSWDDIDEHYLLKHSCGLYVLAAPTNSRDGGCVGALEAQVIIENCKKHFDIVVVDTGPNTSDVTVTAMQHADQLILVANTEIATLSDLGNLQKTLKMINYPSEKVKVIMNSTGLDAEASAIDTMHLIGFENVLGVIPRSSNVTKSNDNASLMVLSGSENAFSAALKKIAGIIVPLDTQSRGGATPKKKGLFSTLFGK